MTFRLKKKSSAIDRRLEDLEKEIAGLNSEIKAAARQTGSKSEPAQRQSVRDPRPEEPGSRRAAPAREASVHADASSASPRKTEREAISIRGDEREKFVSLFSAHNFNELRPLRESGNVLRNKAIMMAVLAALAVIGLLFHVFGR